MLLKKRRGQALLEYAILTAAVALAVLAVFGANLASGGRIGQIFRDRFPVTQPNGD